MSLADRVQLAKLLRASTACDDVLLSVLAVARGPLFKVDASEGKAAAAQPFLLSPSSRCSIGLCREEMQEDQRCAQPARPAPCQSGRPSCGVFNLEELFPMPAGDLGKMKRPSQFVCAFRLLALHQESVVFPLSVLLASGRLRLHSFVRGFGVLEGTSSPFSSPLEKKDSSLTLFFFVFSFFYFFAKTTHKAVSCGLFFFCGRD